jgi:hypothetical protein
LKENISPFHLKLYQNCLSPYLVCSIGVVDGECHCFGNPASLKVNFS